MHWKILVATWILDQWEWRQKVEEIKNVGCWGREREKKVEEKWNHKFDHIARTNKNKSNFSQWQLWTQLGGVHTWSLAALPSICELLPILVASRWGDLYSGLFSPSYGLFPALCLSSRGSCQPLIHTKGGVTVWELLNVRSCYWDLPFNREKSYSSQMHNHLIGKFKNSSLDQPRRD